MKNEKKSLRPIPPTMRGKKRYLLFRLESKGRLNERAVKDVLMKEFLRLYGEVGIARQKLNFITFSPKSGKGIVRCALESVTEVRAGIMFLKEVSGLAVRPETLLTSGSVKKLKEKL